MAPVPTRAVARPAAAADGRCPSTALRRARVGHANAAMKPAPAMLLERLDRLLPQTQCGQCGFDGCRPYAEAMAQGAAQVDRCPPGGDAGARALARVLGIAPQPYDRNRGTHKPPQLAFVIEADCIGCTKCIQVCPVDAIVGGAKYMHTVLAPLCTGCELCVPACPVDCIALRPA
ncbi:electron transport complex protein RnfB [Xanthomonas theicola]|uniref:Electron transport complex protein RnfB n=2 Tax=Xanthomonas theicola TaxID=56464 RepID=A0A2S6ZBM6_9XANT|nr:Rnf electron transport complex subunit RnfB [Xanthomonas theicola]PPT82516.1 electron transport complex protein RnfB [Xanthomonas theicola]QNH25289.1 Rnf electron transport complex subunit RnfB [Xanthomonas theicola]